MVHPKKFLVVALIGALVVSACQTENAYTGQRQTSSTTKGALIGGAAGAILGVSLSFSSSRTLISVTRVVLSVVEYLRQRDWAFVAYTLIVLGALVGSVVAGFGSGR